MTESDVLLLMGSSAYRETKLPDLVMERLDNAISRRMTVIVAEAKGACRAFQDYLNSIGYSNVIIGHARSIRYNAGNWRTKQFGDNLEERETEMIYSCDEVIVIWINNSSVIANNLELLKELGRPTFIYELSYDTGLEKSGMLDPDRIYRRSYPRERRSPKTQRSLDEFW